MRSSDGSSLVCGQRVSRASSISAKLSARRAWGTSFIEAESRERLCDLHVRHVDQALVADRLVDLVRGRVRLVGEQARPFPAVAEQLGDLVDRPAGDTQAPVFSGRVD